jgi:transposase, IS30 family
MGMYTQFTVDERYRLASLLADDIEPVEIAERLGRSPSSISREFLRNSRADGTYAARYAQRQAQERRRQSKRGARKIENNPDLTQFLEDRLHPLISPEVVSIEDDISVSCATIYTWINRSRPDLKTLLPYHGKKRRRYGTKRTKKQGWTQSVRTIDERLAIVEQRESIGHWEGDTVHGINGNLLTYTERKSRFEKASLITRRLCDVVYGETKQMFSRDTVETITYDRGSEFSLWRMIERALGIPIYFAHPYHSWERGSNENANGRLRRVFPKGFNFSTVTQKDVDAVVWIMNHTKRKCLTWRTPCEVYGRCCTSS